MEFGRHALADLYDCENEVLDNIEEIKKIISDSCKEANLTIVESKYHKFEPIGLSGVSILSESHITIHTWPEYKFVSVDAFTCGYKMDPTLVCNIIAQKLKCKNKDIKEYKRGLKYERNGN